jgi:fermentation-respiration switch protein FrsA (DUF1100 family)
MSDLQPERKPALRKRELRPTQGQGILRAAMRQAHPRRKILVALCLAPFAFVLMLRWFEHRQVYHPTAEWDEDPASLGVPFESVEIGAADGPRLSAWFFPAPTNSPRQDLAVLVCHGNGGNISHRLELYRLLLDVGINVFAFDYRGYGRSEGKPSEEGTIRDAQAAHVWLVRRGFAPGRIVGFGESLGGGVVTQLGRREPLGGLVLQSTFTSTPDIGAELFPFLPVRWLARIRYDTCKTLPEIHCPVLILHSRTDDLIPFHHAERNLAAANAPKRLVEIEGGHNDPIDANRARFLDAVRGFIAEVFP